MKSRRLLICFLILLSASLYVFSAPNLQWSMSISMSPSPANVGDTITFTARLWIRFDPVANLRVIGGVDGTNIYDNTFASLRGPSTQDITFTWTTTAGDHRAFLRIDPDGTIAETDETDNFTELGFVCSAPNLTAVRIDCPAGCSDVTAGESVRFHFSFSLYGARHLTNVRIIAGINGGAVLYDNTLPEIGDNGEIFFDHIFTAGEYIIYASIDPRNEISESNERDNRVVMSLIIPDSETRSDDSGRDDLSPRSNYKIEITHKKIFEELSPFPSTTTLSITGKLSHTGNKSPLPSLIPVRLFEENLSLRTPRKLVHNDTISVLSNSWKIFTWKWKPPKIGKWKLILQIVLSADDSVPEDNTDEVSFAVIPPPSHH